VDPFFLFVLCEKIKLSVKSKKNFQKTKRFSVLLKKNKQQLMNNPGNKLIYQLINLCWSGF